MGYRKATPSCNGLILEAKFGDDPLLFPDRNFHQTENKEKEILQ